MKRLLLLFILSPVILFGQMRRKAIVDSIKTEATNLQSVSTLIGNNPGSRVEHINVSDSGEYVTIVVRIHVPQAIAITVLLPLPVVKIEIGDIVADMVSTVTVPPLPPLVAEPDTIIALSPVAVFKFNTGGIPVVKVYPVTVPPLPDAEMAEILPLLAVTLIRIEDIVVGKTNLATVPTLPYIELETIEDLPLFAVVKFAIEDRPAGKMDTVAVPGFEENKMPVTEMHLSAEGYSLLEKLEGFSPRLYSLKDGGLTIGFGFFVPYGEGNKWRNGVTWEEAERMIRQKVPAYEDQVKQYINVPLTQNEFDALTMLAYNLGGFSKATSIVNDVNRQADFDKLQSDWKRFVHSKAHGVMKGLMNRRKDELEVRNESNYQPEREIQIFKN